MLKIPRLSSRFMSLAVEPMAITPRLESHYYDEVYENLMIMNYDHTSPNADITELESFAEWENSDQYFNHTFTTHLNHLPTKPADGVCTNLLSTQLASKGLHKKVSGFIKRLKNPIDYTSIRKESFNARPPLHTLLPYSPLPSRVPALRRIDLRIWAEDAVLNKSILLSAIMSLQAITGRQALPLFATKGDASKRIREGMPLGATVSIDQQEMFTFLDKLTQCVLPRIREWKGINPIGDNQGSLSITIPASVVGTFPDIEPHFDSFPRLFDTEITFKTSGNNDRETLMLLSGFQLPFLDEAVVEKIEVAVVDDPFAAIKLAKTREERKALFSQMDAKTRSVKK